MRAGRHDGRKRLYLDFDGYFAAVEEQAAPALHGRPVAVLPYEGARTCVISSNAEAKRHGVGTGTGVDEARRRCPGIALVGADYKAARKAVRSAPRRTGRKPHEAVELVLAGPPPYDGAKGEPWTLERERAWVHTAYGWVRTILGPESVIAAAAWHRDETAPHIHVLAVPRPEGGNGRIGWCATRDQAVSRICDGAPAGSRYRVLQDDLHARVSLHFGLGRGVVGSEARHEAIDRAKAVESPVRARPSATRRRRWS